MAHDLFDFVQRPIETTTPIHILSPCPYLFYVDSAFLVARDMLSLCGAKASQTHGRHHTRVIIVHGIHLTLFYDRVVLPYIDQRDRGLS